MNEGTANTTSDPPAPPVEDQPQPVRHWWQNMSREGWALTVISAMIIGVVILAGYVTYLRIEQIRDQNAFDQKLISLLQPITGHTAATPATADEAFAQAETARITAEVALAEAQRLTADAEDSQNSVNLLLSFFEGATVLVGIALGAAAYFGFRNFREIRDDARTDREKTSTLLSTLEGKQAVLEETLGKSNQAVTEAQKQSEQIIVALNLMNKTRSEMDREMGQAQEIFSQLVLAYQEMRLGNHQEAYRAAIRVLNLDPNNVQALYLAGWLENQYIKDESEREKALPHLLRAVEIDNDWPSARAALGVIQRRRAMQAREEGAREKLFRDAEYNLKRALLDNPRLLDPNLESFWAPLGGLYRDWGKYDEAQKAYERACDVTPGSSYPAGNLAALYLRDHKINNAPLQPALDKFKDALRLAQIELAQTPSDYFIMMDIAMSTLILSGHDAQEYPPDDADYFFNKALIANPTDELRSVTKRGLQNLIDYCPDEEDWQEVKEHLDQWLSLL